MTARNPILRRVAPSVDEPTYAYRLATYLAHRRHHPAVAHILAYEEATGTGSRHTKTRKHQHANKTGTN